MAMVIEEMKALEEVPAPRSGVAKASDALIALVRGARQKNAASMLGVVKSGQTTDFVPSDPKPKGKAVLMMPRHWGNAQEFRPVNASSSQGKDPSTKDSEKKSNSLDDVIPPSENDKVGKTKMTKTDPLSIRNEKKRPFKSDGQDSNFLCGKFCKFRAKGIQCETDSFGSEKYFPLLLLI
jgi:hypothetical protein